MVIDLVDYWFNDHEAVVQHDLMAATAVILEVGGGDIVAVADPQHAITFGEFVLVTDHGCDGILGSVAGTHPNCFIV